jgi:hypothetical protein
MAMTGMMTAGNILASTGKISNIAWQLCAIDLLGTFVIRQWQS